MVPICLPCLPIIFLHCSHAYGSQLSLELSLKLNFYVVTNVNISHSSIPPSDDDFSTVALFLLSTTQNENHPTTYAAIKNLTENLMFLPQFFNSWLRLSTG